MSQNIGPAIKESFEFLMSNFRDTSTMLGIIESFTKKNKLVSETGATSAWNRSWAHYGYWGWMPHYLFRGYRSADKKDQSNGRFRLFFGVYFAPERYDHPILIYGAAQLHEDTYLLAWAKNLAVNEGPAFIEGDHIIEWLVAPTSEEVPVREMYVKTVQLVKVNSQAEVEKICQEALDKFCELREH